MIFTILLVFIGLIRVVSVRFKSFLKDINIFQNRLVFKLATFFARLMHQETNGGIIETTVRVAFQGCLIVCVRE